MLFFLFLDFLLTNTFSICEHFVQHNNRPFIDLEHRQIDNGCNLGDLVKTHDNRLNDAVILVDPEKYKLLNPKTREINNEAVNAILVGDNRNESGNNFTAYIVYPPENVAKMSNSEIVEFVRETTHIDLIGTWMDVGKRATFVNFRVEAHNDLLNIEIPEERAMNVIG